MGRVEGGEQRRGDRNGERRKRRERREESERRRRSRAVWRMGERKGEGPRERWAGG